MNYTLTEIIDDKIAILHELGILGYRAKKQEECVRLILAECKNEIQIDQRLHDVIVGRKSVKELIASRIRN